MPNKSSPHGGFICEGAISHGTFLQEDLLRSFANELERVFPFNGTSLVHEAREALAALEANPDAYLAQLTAMEVLSDVIDQLDSIAGREGMYFGTREGDGSDFGFWKLEEEQTD